MKLLPEVRDDDLISRLQLIDIPEIAGTAPASMARDDCVRISSTHWDTGLGEQRSSIGHMLVCGA